MTPTELKFTGWNLLAMSQNGSGLVTSFIARRGWRGPKFYGSYNYKTKLYTIERL